MTKKNPCKGLFLVRIFYTQMTIICTILDCIFYVYKSRYTRHEKCKMIR